MNILFSPQGGSLLSALSAVLVDGDTLSVNGTDFDLTALEYDEETGLAGYIQSAIQADGEWTVTLLLPLTENASEAQRFPAPVSVTSGPVPLPEPPEPETEDSSAYNAG
ncbi:hypothetical protein ABEB22_10815 [Thioclava sp. 'Guangxiensis']|uniref:hypothetical protein n=1 Tax=Thioclava sp. 'Guangxiensis' TaxID=3149044 RepID=UPI0038783E0B